jgi:pSer/pThr/pTyr-binding forkhead associated (FHA) protein
MRCPNCNAENEAGSRFCAQCGTMLNPPQPAEPVQVNNAETIVGPSGPLSVIVLAGPDRNKTASLVDQMSVGREVDNNLILSDPRASRHHALIVRRGQSFVVEDLDSANGVFINGRRISGSQPINLGDKLTIGDTEMTLRSTPSAETLVSVSASTAVAAQAAAQAQPDATDQTPVRMAAVSPSPQPAAVPPPQPVAAPPPRPVAAPPPPAPAAVKTPVAPPPVTTVTPRKKENWFKWGAIGCLLLLILVILLLAVPWLIASSFMGALPH